MQQREKFSSRLGFILISAGCAIGLGNVYRFPIITGAYGGAIFVILSGCCATLGSRSFRRGALVFACGMLITLVTWGMYLLHMAGADVVVKFGVLHLLGICMMLYPLFKKLPTAAICAVSAVCIVVGYLLQGMVFEVRWLFPLGVLYPGFTSSDYFPVFPQLGWFLLGVVLGRTFYREKRTLLPGRAQDFFLLRFFRVVLVTQLLVRVF